MSHPRSHSLGGGEPGFASEFWDQLWPPVLHTPRALAATICGEPGMWSAVQTLSPVVLMWSVQWWQDQQSPTIAGQM